MTLRRVATFVSNALVERLISKNALDRKLAKEIRLNVRERIDALFSVIGQPIRHSVHHPGSATGCSYLPWSQHIETQGIVRLIAGAVAHYGTGRQPKISGSGGSKLSLPADGRHPRGVPAVRW